MQLTIINTITMSETINDRIEMLINERFNGNKAAFAKSIGLPPTGLSSYISKQRRSKPSIDLVISIVQAHNVDALWLLTGSEATNANSNSIAQQSTIEELPIARRTTNPQEGIPLIPLDAMAGALTSEQTILECDCDRYVVPDFRGADFLISVKGASMQPSYSSGDIVACKRIPMTDLFFQWNKVYVIDTNQGALIKRVKPGHDENHILIVSDNESFDAFELPKKSIYAVALVVGVIRLE